MKDLSLNGRARMDPQLDAVLDEYNENRPERVRHKLCHAPFVNLNFDQSGDVTACCYGRNFPLGRYPENTIQEIWNSAKANELREALTNYELKGDCRRCHEQIVSKNFHLALARNFDEPLVNGEEAVQTGPRMLEFELANICNLECIMCRGHFSALIRKNREKLPPLPNRYDDRFVEQLRPFWKTVEWAKFMGGEPFLNPLHYKIWRQILEEKSATKVTITTNATVMNKNVEWVLENIKPYMVFSIDSLQKETYEKIRKNAKFEKTKENLRRFMEYGFRTDRDYGIAVCPMIHNWQELPSIFDWGTQNLANVYLNTVIWPPELSLKSLGAQKLREIAREFRSYRLKTWQDFHKDAPPWIRENSDVNQKRFTGLINHIEFWADELSGKEGRKLALNEETL